MPDGGRERPGLMHKVGSPPDRQVQAGAETRRPTDTFLGAHRACLTHNQQEQRPASELRQIEMTGVAFHFSLLQLS
jgi:hypothetical protein